MLLVILVVTVSDVSYDMQLVTLVMTVSDISYDSK